MIQVESILHVSDNSGVRLAKCIRVLGGANVRLGGVGKFIIVALPSRRVYRKFISRHLYLGIIAAVNVNVRRRSGFYLKLNKNKVILLSEQGKIVGSRIYGSVFSELRTSGLSKILQRVKLFI